MLCLGVERDIVSRRAMQRLLSDPLGAFGLKSRFIMPALASIQQFKPNYEEGNVLEIH